MRFIIWTTVKKKLHISQILATLMDKVTSKMRGEIAIQQFFKLNNLPTKWTNPFNSLMRDCKVFNFNFSSWLLQRITRLSNEVYKLQWKVVKKLIQENKAPNMPTHKYTNIVGYIYCSLSLSLSCIVLWSMPHILWIRL